MVFYTFQTCVTQFNHLSTFLLGIQVDFIVDAKWGRAESLYIPVLEVNQVKKACLQLQPFICSATTIEAR